MACACAVAMCCARPAAAVADERIRALPAAGTSPVWAQARQVSGITTLDDNGSAQVKAVSCAAAGACGAGGFYTDGHQDQAFVVSETGGAWGSARGVPTIPQLNVGGDAEINTISCFAAGECGASGYYRDAAANTQSFVAQESGVWDGSLEVQGTGGSFSEPNSESCPSFGRCTIGGFFADSQGDEQPYVDDQNLSWPAALPLPGNPNAGMVSMVTSVSCRSAGNCAAGGWYSTANGAQQAFVAAEKNGAWQSAVKVATAQNKGGDAQVNQVSCGSPGNCAAVGAYAPASGQQTPFVVNEKNGTWGPMLAVPGIVTLDTGHFGGLSSVSCASAGNCTMEGYYNVAKPKAQSAFVATEKNGALGSAVEVPGLGALNSSGVAVAGPVSCVSPGTCSAAGEYKAGGHFQVWVTSERLGGWATAQPLLGLVSVGGAGAFVNGLSCATTGSCGMVGYYYDAQDHQQPFVATGAIARPTSITQTLSAHTVAYGHEQSERVSVHVSGGYGLPPGGSATVKAGGTVACVAKLTGGAGACEVPATKFGAGHVSLVAYYDATVEFSSSRTAAQTFTVTKAGTRTSLALSAGRITYGHEQAERLTADVAPRYAGVPAGTVTVTAGTTTLCRITLKGGKGSCPLAAARLRPGGYSLVARYPGSGGFAGSASPPKTLTVVR